MGNSHHGKPTMRRAVALALTCAVAVAACSSGDDAISDNSSGSTEATEVTTGETIDGAGTTLDTTIDTSVGTTASTTGGAAPAGEGWTVLVYSIADTDLEPYLLTDLAEMAEVGSNEGLNIVALVDRAAEYSDEPLLNIPDWQGGKLLTIEQGSMTEEVDLGDINTGDPQLLADFITTGIQQNPAEHYALIVSDHGAAWPGVGGDESSDSDGLSVAELRDGIAAGLQGAGVDKLDLLGFDACLMATYEVATTMAPLADRMLASQELEPGHGWDYTALSVLAQDSSTDVDTLGSALIDGFEAQAAAEGTKSEITLSMVDLTQMGAVDDALATFTSQLQERAATIAPVVGRSRAQNLGFGKSPDPAEDTQMTDLGLLASQIGVDALDVSDAADALVRAINDSVLDSVVGAATRGATGLSIYFPPYASLYNADYASVTPNGGWTDFLASFYSAGSSIATEDMPQFQNVDDQAETFFDDDGVNIVGTFDFAAQDNLADAVISYGTIEEDGSVTFIGEEPAAISDDGSGTALGIYDLTALTITDGVDTAYAYLALTLDEESGIASIDVPMAYYAPDQIGGDTYQDVLLTLTVDSATGDIINETYYTYNNELGTYGELTADPTGIIVPEVLSVLADGTSEWIPTSDVGLYADLPSLQYDFVPLTSGTSLYVDLTVTDYGGNSDTVYATVVVP